MLLGAAAGCGVGAEAPMVVTQLSPEAAYNDRPLAAVIAGAGFRPAYRFDTGPGSAGLDVGGFSATLHAVEPTTGGGRPSFPLTALIWESVGLLGGVIPAGLPAGNYDLLVSDPRGRQSRLPSAFTSLGVDTIPPAVAITAPPDGAVVGAGAALAVIATADDGYGQLDSLRVTFATEAGSLPPYDCPLVPGAARATCPVTVTLPAPADDADTLVIAAQASGSGGLSQTTQIAVQLVPAPTPTGIYPAAGSALGGTAVTIFGDNIVPGTTTVAFDGQAADIHYATSTIIIALAPAHPPGWAKVTLTTGGATAALSGVFTYLAPPIAREVSPASAPAAGFVPITVVGDNFTYSTEITVGGNPLLCPVWISANRIEGYVPPGMGPAPITAYDSRAGGQPGAAVPFVYLAPPDGSDGGVGAEAGAPPDAASPFGDGGCPGAVGP
jgi:hypothetical protein